MTKSIPRKLLMSEIWCVGCNALRPFGPGCGMRRAGKTICEKLSNYPAKYQLRHVEYYDGELCAECMKK